MVWSETLGNAVLTPSQRQQIESAVRKARLVKAHPRDTVGGDGKSLLASFAM